MITCRHVPVTMKFAEDLLGFGFFKEMLELTLPYRYLYQSEHVEVLQHGRHHGILE
jgi:hypothetical protein